MGKIDKKMETKKLTVVITTFNRKEPLLEQLNSLRVQGHFEDYCIYVTDNHSDYDVKEWLESQLPQNFMDIIEVFSWPINTGHTINCSLAFLYPETEWMWLLSDDDITTPNSLETILKDIAKEENKDVCWMKYSITGFTPNTECYIDSVKGVFDYYHSKPAGEFIFVCNNVFRMSFLRKYLTSMLINCDNCICPEMLPLYAIKNDNKKVYFSHQSLTNYTVGRLSWQLIWAFSRFGNILLSDLNFTKAEILSFKKINFFSGGTFISCLAGINRKCLRHEFFKRIFTSHYTLFSIKGIKVLMGYLFLSLFGSRMWSKYYKI